MKPTYRIRPTFFFGPTFFFRPTFFFWTNIFFWIKIFWVRKNLRGGQKLWGRGPKLGVIALWSIWSLDTKSWPHTKPRTLQKVFGRWWVVGGWFTVNLAFCFGPKLWVWTWTKLNNCLFSDLMNTDSRYIHKDRLTGITFKVGNITSKSVSIHTFKILSKCRNGWIASNS